MSLSAQLTSDYLLGELRALLSDLDPSGSARWSDPTLYRWLDRSNKWLVGEVLFPDCRIEQPTLPNVQLYRFPLMLKTARVYVGGQLVYPTDIPTLEGQQIGYAQELGTPGQMPQNYSDVPPNTPGPGAPGWMVTEPLSYPDDCGQWVTPAPDAQPWYCSSPARYYWRGGWLGIVPIPTNANPPTTIAVEGVRQPDTIDAPGMTISSPDNFVDAICWKAATYAKFADSGSRSAQQMDKALQMSEVEKRRLKTWVELYPGEQRNGPKVNTLRPAFSWGRTRRYGNRGYGY